MIEKTIETYLDEQWRIRVRGECIKFPPIFYRGFPDRICFCWPGWVMFVETKAPEGRTSKIQDVVHAKLRAFGLWVEVLYTKEMVDNFIDRVCEHITNLTRTKSRD
jgi:hypothetical protein